MFTSISLVCCRLFRCLGFFGLGGRCRPNSVARLILGVTTIPRRRASLVLISLIVLFCLVFDLDNLSLFFTFFHSQHHHYRPSVRLLPSGSSLKHLSAPSAVTADIQNWVPVINNHRYLVYSSQCQMIEMPLFDEETGPLYHNQSYREIECSRSLLTIERVNHTSVHIPAIDLPNSKLECYAQAVKRDLADMVRIHPTRYGPLKSVSNFPWLDAVRVQCFQPMVTRNSVVPRSMVDSRVVPLIPHRSSSESILGPSSSERPNVLLLGIDSISFLNFRRHFIRTQEFMSRHQFVAQHGFSKVGDNTFPNLVALLTGHHYTHYWNNSFDSDFKFDYVPVIWKRFQASGYMTSLVEDMPGYSIFNYNRAGFNQSPTDYYLRPVSLLVDQQKSHRFCYRGQLTIEFYYSWILDQMEALTSRGQPYLTVSHLADLTHDLHLNAGQADRPLFGLLSAIFARNLNQNTVIIVFSDHGIRFGRLRQTRSGFVEERLPFLYVYIPDGSFLGMDPEQARRALSINNHRLTTHFDIHATLRHILDRTPPTDEPFGHSLLVPIPLNRTCSSAGISPEWCLCTEYLLLPQQGPLARMLGYFVVKNINRKLIHYRPKCSRLKLWKIEEIKLETSQQKQSHNLTIQRYLVRLRVTPSDALFEATVNILPLGSTSATSTESHNLRPSGSNRMQIVGDISRLNRYSKQSGCIRNFILEKFCHCK